MGFGDEIIGSGIARGSHKRGKRIAFGDGSRIIWSKHAHEIFRGNPNVARPGCERAHDLEWVAHYPGHRLYAKAIEGVWRWTENFRVVPGEIYFDRQERDFRRRHDGEFIVIEPHVKPTAPNKCWPFYRFQLVTDKLRAEGHRVVQFAARAGLPELNGVEIVKTPTFRSALTMLSAAKLYIGPEGGLHHGAAALDINAVVIFGGFISPEITGYASHKNLFVGDRGCGTMRRCSHCQDAMDKIEVYDVLLAAFEQLSAAPKSSGAREMVA